jgi:dihydropteroate synthase
MFSRTWDVASAVLGVVHGAHVLRVHDVREVGRAVRVAEAIRNEEPEPDSKGHARYVS